MEHMHHHHHQQQDPQQEKARGNHQQDQGKQLQDHSMHDKHAGHHTGDFLKRFWICLALTIPVLLLSEMIQH